MEGQLANVSGELETARLSANSAREKFEEIVARRSRLFRDAFDHVNHSIERVYQELTRSVTYPNGGSASLNLENVTVRPH